jgi:hypothetical protein
MNKQPPPLLGLSDVAAVSSPRTERLRAIAARIVELEKIPGFDTHNSPEFLALENEVEVIAEEVWASPVRGPMDILERAIIAHSYCADGVGDNGEHVLCYFGPEDGATGTRAVNHLIHAIFELAGLPEGSAND